jgi:hypothetical protein
MATSPANRYDLGRGYAAKASRPAGSRPPRWARNPIFNRIGPTRRGSGPSQPLGVGTVAARGTALAGRVGGEAPAGYWASRPPTGKSRVTFATTATALKSSRAAATKPGRSGGSHAPCPDHHGGGQVRPFACSCLHNIIPILFDIEIPCCSSNVNSCLAWAPKGSVQVPLPFDYDNGQTRGT